MTKLLLNIGLYCYSLLISSALNSLVNVVDPIQPQIIYDANEIRYLFLAEDKQLLCRSNGDIEVYTGVFEKKEVTFSVGKINVDDNIFFLEKNNRIAKVAMPERGINISLYDYDIGKMVKQIIIDESEIYDFKIDNEKLCYTCSDGYYLYDLQVKTQKRLISFSSFPIIETAKLGLDNISCVLFGEMQIIGIDKNGTPDICGCYY